MRAFFYKYGCGYCSREKFGMVLANMKLPVGRMINFVDIESGDPRVSVIGEIFNKTFAPVIIIDNERPYKYGNSYLNGRTRFAIASTFGNYSTSSIIKNLLWEEVI